jgi:hypothetical protein
VLDGSFPEHAFQKALSRLFVLHRWPNITDPTDANNDPAKLFDKWNLFSVKEAKGSLRADVPEETIENRFLVSEVLHPPGIKAEVRLAVRIQAEIEFFRTPTKAVLAHPGEWNGRSRKRRLAEGGWRKMPVSLRRTLAIGMSDGSRNWKIRHESRTLCDAARPLVSVKNIQRQPSNRLFSIVITLCGDFGQP